MLVFRGVYPTYVFVLGKVTPQPQLTLFLWLRCTWERSAWALYLIDVLSSYTVGWKHHFVTAIKASILQTAAHTKGLQNRHGSQVCLVPPHRATCWNSCHRFVAWFFESERWQKWMFHTRWAGPPSSCSWGEITPISRVTYPQLPIYKGHL